MPLTIMTLFANVSASASGAASSDIPEDGFIVGVDWTIGISTGGGFQSADSMTAQLSFVGTSQFATNDVRGPISMATTGVGAVTTSGVASVQANKWVGFPEPMQVAGGERIFLHVTEVGVAAVDIWVLVHLRTGRAIPRRSARRR